MKLRLFPLLFAVTCALSLTACSSSSGSRSEPDASASGATGADSNDGSTDAADQSTDAADGATDSSDETATVDGADGATGLDGASAADGATSDNSATDGADGTPPPVAVCKDGAFECKDSATLMICEGGQWRLKHNCPAPYECDADAGTCTKQSCTPEGTGKDVGDIVKDISFDLPGGGTYNLHDACLAQESTFIVKVDTWCYWCGEYASLWQFMADEYVKHGSRFLLLVGRDGQQAPATVQIAEAYKATHGYNDNWIVAVDPAHLKIESVINVYGGGVPNLAVLGPDMRIVYIDPAEGGTLKAPFDALAEASGYNPPQTCSGYCQTGLSHSWCYCNADCAEYGDCCPDACDACGVNCN